MAERGIIFSAPMVLAIGQGHKTQTRRLASSPLRQCVPGDVLYVRETWRTLQKWNDIKPRHVMDDIDKIDFAASGFRRNKLWAWGKTRPAIFMPRWASRFDLIVEAVRTERLQEISEQDCLAEGPKVKGYADFGELSSLNGIMVETDKPHVTATPRCWYRELWSSLHTKEGQRWDDNPEVLVLTFRVERRF